jgi:hypothetical protein
MTATLLHILMAVHTLIGAVSTACLVYLAWAAWHRRRPAADKLLVFALAWPLANLTLMAVNGMACPLQNAAQALTGTHTWVRDIYWVPQSWLSVIPWTYPIGYALGVLAVWARAKPTHHGRP